MSETGGANATVIPGPLLEGLTVLDLASVGPAARASRILADYGARVVKIGPVPADTARQITPPYYAYAGGRLTERIQLNLKADAGRRVFLDLAAGADVVIESFRPGVVDRLGIGYEAASADNPGLVYCSTSGFGQTGPRSQWAGHDVNYLAVAGYLHCSTPRADGGPPLPGATVADIAAGGMQAAMAIMAALLGRAAHGRGSYLDVSIADGALAMMSLYTDEFLATGTEPGPGHYVLTGRFAWYDVYRCADDRWISVGAIEPAFFRNVCRELGLDRFSGRQYDDEAVDEMRQAFTTAFAAQPSTHWCEVLGAGDGCVAPVQTVAEALVDEQFAARHAVVDARRPDGSPVQQAAALYAGTTPPPADGYRLVDYTATHSRDVLARLGYTADHITELEKEGVIA